MEQFIVVQCPAPVTVPVLGGTKTITEVRIYSIEDNFFKKELWASCDDHPTKILVWEGQAYDDKGEWTTADVVTRILEIFDNTGPIA